MAHYTVAEELLSYLLMEPKHVELALEKLSPKHFVGDRERILFTAIAELCDEGVDRGPMAVAFRCRSLAPELESDFDTWATYVMGLLADAQVINVRHFCMQIKDQWRRHRLRLLAKHTSSVLEKQEATDKIMSDIETSITEISDDQMKEHGDGSIGNALNKMADLVEQNKGKGGLIGIPTGYPNFDKHIHGIQKKTVTIIAGRPSMGKTCFAINVMMNMARKGHKVAMFSIEMPEESVAYRMVSMYSGVEMGKIMSGTMDEQESKGYALGIEAVSKLPIRIFDYLYTAPAIIRAIRRLHRTEGIEAAVVDYLQHIKLPGRKDKREEIGDVSRMFKELAKELGIAVILVSQLNRGSDARTDKRPMLSDMKDSGDIEQDADVVAMLYNDYYYNKDASESFSDVTIAKNRQGMTGRVDFFWERKTQLFVEADYFAT